MSDKKEFILCGIGTRSTDEHIPHGKTMIPLHADTPAARAGIKAGDILLAAREENGEWYNVFDLDSFNRVRGPIGTTVHLRVLTTTGEEKEFAIRRAPVSDSPDARPALSDLPNYCGAIYSEMNSDTLLSPPQIAVAKGPDIGNSRS